jgi:riboflavin synthase
VDGVSLTVIRKTADTFSVSLVEYTQAHTTHFQKRCGARVNLETDLLARYVGAVLEARAGWRAS